jgi:O-antigen/teichoic acid export membrane protein
MKAVAEFTKRNSDKISYLLLNYLAYLMNFASGLILARSLGPEKRGVVAFLSNLFLITLLIAPLNAKNASSIAEAGLKSEEKCESREFSTYRVASISAVITLVTSITYYYALAGRLSNSLIMLFCIANLFNSIAVVIQIREGILRTQNRLDQLAIIRFLGYATPSFFVFILFFFKKIEIEYVIFGQVVAMLSTLLFLVIRRFPAPDYSTKDFSDKAFKTFGTYFLEYICNFIPLLLVMLSEQYAYIGLFAIAYGFSLISDTYFNIVESKVYSQLANIERNLPKSAVKTLSSGAKSLCVAQLLFVPLALLIPMLYGNLYSGSVQIAIFLIFSKLLYSILKIECIYINLVLKRYRVPVLLNLLYAFSASSIFLISEPLAGVTHPWIVSVLIPSLFLPILGAFYIRINSLDTPNQGKP